MRAKFWFRQGESDPYLCSIPVDTEYISDVITLIHTDTVAKIQLKIPKDYGAIRLCRPNGTVLSNGLEIAKLLNEEFFINNSEHPIIVQVGSSRETSKGHVCKSNTGSTVDDAHVFTRQRLNLAKWKPEPPLIYSPEAGEMMVNEPHSIEQLHEIHMSKYERAISSVGDDWVIPLADNLVGLSKHVYGQYYIHQSRELWKDIEKKNDFQKTLLDCHTVHIIFRRGDLLRKTFDSVILEYLIEALKPLFEVEPDVLITPPSRVDDFLDDLTRTVGPVFIVLDEVGAAFDGDDLDDDEKKQQFQSLCRNILGNWQSLAKVFFVLLGRESFLKNTNLIRLSNRISKSRMILL